MDFREVKEGLGDCDFMRAFLNEWTVEAVLFLINEVESLQQYRSMWSADRNTAQACLKRVKELEARLLEIKECFPDNPLIHEITSREFKDE